MTKRLLLLPIAMMFTLSGCWWNSKKTAPADQSNEAALADQAKAEALVITQITTEQQFSTLLKESTKLIVVKVDAPWCSACKDLHPHFVEAATKGTEFTFTRINVDIVPSIAQQYEVVGIPTMLFIKNGKEISNSRIEGAEIKNGDELLAKIKSFDTITEPAVVTEQTNLVAQNTL